MWLKSDTQVSTQKLNGKFTHKDSIAEAFKGDTLKIILENESEAFFRGSNRVIEPNTNLFIA